MAGYSKIEWTELTWNPTRGCSRVSAGCEHCYAERQAHRQNRRGGAYEGLTRLTARGPVWSGRVRLVQEQLEVPLRWRKPRHVFVDSMSDLFHERLKDQEIARVFEVMQAASQHTYQVLTKRADRMAEWSQKYRHLIGSHMWLGASIEDQQCAEERTPWLRKTHAAVRFLSCEPLLGPLELDLSDIAWVIVGGESGPEARRMEEAWVKGIRDQCIRHDVAFFFKQWGGVQKKRTGRILEGQTWDELPTLAESEPAK